MKITNFPTPFCFSRTTTSFFFTFFLLVAFQSTSSGQTISGTKTIGPSGNYTSIKAAVTAINAVGAGLGGPLVLELQSGYVSTVETFPVSIPALTGSSSVNTVTIRPAAGATGRSITSSSTTGTINVSGGKYVTFDGRPGGTGTAKELTIENTSGASGYAVQFMNEASGNTIKYCKVKSNNTSVNSGSVIFGTTNGASGNDNNTLSNDDIGDASYTATNAVYGLGTTTTTATSNSSNTVDNCNIFNFFISTSVASGIYLRTGNSDWTITANSFYQTAARAYTAAGSFICVNINNNAGNNFIVSNNYIGGSAASAGSAAWTETGAFSHTFTAIKIIAGTATPSSVQGNTVKNISISTSASNTSVGLITAAGGSINIGTIAGNTIGSTSANGSIVYNGTTGSQLSGIMANSTSVSSIINISNNSIAGISMGGAGTTAFRGIYIQGGVTKYLVYKNLIGSETISNSISNSTNTTTTGIASASTSTTNNIIENTIANIDVSNTGVSSYLYGISIQSGSNNVTGNTIHNFSSLCTYGGQGTTGINFTVSNTANQIVSKNTIYSLSNNNTGSSVVSTTGILYNGPSTGTNKVSGNFIHSLNVASSVVTASIIGISSNGGTTLFENNMVRLGIKADGTSVTTGYVVVGLRISGTTPSNKVYHNSIYIGGTGVSASASATYAFQRNTAGYALDIKNNVFVNVRANSATGIKHYTVRLNFTDFAAEGTSINYNLYYAPGTDNAVGNVGSATYTTIANWRSSTGFDIAGISSNPNFTNALGDSSAVNLHISSPTPIEGNGTSLSTVLYDFDSTIRSSITPVDLGADAGNFTGSDLAPVNIAYTPIGKGISTTNRVLTGFATITDNVAVSGGLNSPRLYYKKSGDADVFGANTSATNGWKYVTTSSTSSPYSFTIDYSILRTAVVAGDVIQYFVIAQDDANNYSSLPSGATAGSPPVQNVTAKPTVINSFTIAGLLSGTKTIPGDYTSLTGASGLFADINSKILSGNLSVVIGGNLTETGANALNQWDETGAGNYTVTIASDGTARTVSATAVAANTPMININGADRLTFSGGSGSQRLLTFRNTNTTSASAGPTFQFVNSSTSCTLNNCIIENNESTLTSGSVVVGMGINNVFMSNNDIRDATAGTAGAPYNAIYTSGTANNTTVNISGNNIYNVAGVGINLPSLALADGCTISGNSIYQTSTAPAAVTGSVLFTGISINSGSGHTIQSNYIGGQAAGATGNPYVNSAAVVFTGIDLGTGANAITTVQANKVGNISLSSAAVAFKGISLTAGTSIINSNLIGDASTSNSIQYDGSSPIYGIYVVGLDSVTVQSDTVANINATGSSFNNQLTGIYANSTSKAYSITSNRIYNLKSAALASPAGGSISGIYITGTSNSNVISRNRIYNLENTATGSVSPRLTGIYATGTAGGTISRNRIYNFLVSGSNTGSPEMRAILTAQSNDPIATIVNNQISFGNNVATNAVIQGISDSASTAMTQYLYYNTVYIGGTVSSGASNSAAWFKQNAFTTETKNNIFYNERTGGTGSHYAVSFFSSGNTVGSANDYNLLVAGNVNKLAEYGSGVNQTLAQWRASTGGAANSITVTTSVLPAATAFSSLTNGNLSLGIEYRYVVGAKGNAVSEIIDYSGNSRNTPPGIGSIEYSVQPGVWIGSADTAWTNTLNWGDGIVPLQSTNVTIPVHVSHMPYIAAGVQYANDLTIQSGASLTVSNATLKISGIPVSSGTFTVTKGTVEMNGSTDQTIPAGLFAGNAIQNLVISNNVALAGQVYVSGAVSFGNANSKTFSTAGYLTLGSSAAGTSRVADVTNSGVNSGNSISGAVVTEKYIPAKRAYRFLSAPVNSSGSIRANWMENSNNANTSVNNNPVPDYGTHITGYLGNTNGFDASQTNNPSMYTYDNQAQTWVALPNTAGTFKAGNAYRILIRGSRSTDLTLASPAPSPTTLRATGSLVSGTVVMAKPGGGTTVNMPDLSPVINTFNFIGNPYASPADWSTIERTNVGGTMYIFDPTISGSNGRGAYVSYNAATGSNNNGSSLIDNNIQSWQSFFVLTTGTNPSITFRETNKTSQNRAVFKTPSDRPRVTVQLLLPQQVLAGGSADGFAAYFDDEFSSEIGDEDSYKFSNQDENMGILRNGKVLSIEGRKTVTDLDTLPVKMWQLTQSSYALKIGSYNFPASINCYLEDAYLQTSTLINSGADTMLPFSITTDAASFATDRFRIVFKIGSVLPVELVDIKAFENNKGADVLWTVAEESNVKNYEVQRSSDATEFKTIGTVDALKNSAQTNNYSLHDDAPVNGDNFYRIKVISNAGEIKYSDVAKVHTGTGKSSMVIFPNPVEGNTLNIQLKNLDKGEYFIKLISASGQQMYAGKIKHAGGSSARAIKMNTHVATGLYRLQLTNESIKLNETAIFK